MMNPTEILLAGCEILEPVLVPHGFARRPFDSGSSSGGYFARTEYVRKDRRVELHFRGSLGLVAYHLGALSITHEDYMRAVLGRRGGNQYPGFSEDPLDGFRHLRHDLERYCPEFLGESDDAFRQVVAMAAAQPRATGFRALSSRQE